MIEPETRKETRQNLTRFAQATIDALRSNICVLDEQGIIVSVNQAWRTFAQTNLPLPTHASEGANYLAICDSATGPDSQEAAAFAAGIREVLSGARDEFVLEYPCHSPEEKRWFLGRVTRLEKTPPHWAVVSHENITARRLTEESLRESQHLLQQVFKATPVLIYVFDLVQRRHVFSNQSALTLLGYGPDEPKDVLPREYPSILHPDDLPKVAEHHARMCTARDDEILEVEYRMRDAAGQWRWLRSRDIPFLRDAEGLVRQVLGAAEDITQRKAVEQAILQAQDDWTRTFDAIPDLIFIIDQHHRIQRANRAMAERLGVAPEELIGRTCYSVFHGAATAPQSCPHTRSLADHQIVSDEVFEEHLGTYFQVTVSPLFDAQGKRTGSVHVTRDITDRKRAERAIEESEAKYRGITQRCFDTIFVTDLAGRALYVSPAAENLIGERPEDLLGRHFNEFVIESDVPRIVAAFERIARGGPAETVEAQVRRIDGKLLFLEATGAPVFSEGRLAGVQVIARDVTQRKESEERVRSMETQVMHTARLSTMGEMVASIAHEVSQPLFSILNYSKAVQNLLEAEGEPRVALALEWNGEITKAASRSGEIIARLRNFVRRADDRRAAAAIGEIIKESVTLVAHDCRQHQVAVHLDLGEGDSQVVVDRVQIQQVLVNLLRNACDALMQTSEPRQVTVATRTTSADVVVSVADNGPGLAAADRSNLFEPFYTTKPNGLGIGLAISRTIVEAHGGSLWAENGHDDGATFCFTLPIAGAVPPTTHPSYVEPSHVEHPNRPRRGRR